MAAASGEVSEDDAEQLERARRNVEESERVLAENSSAFRKRFERFAVGLGEISEALPDGAALVSYVRFHREDMAVVLLDIVERSAIPLAGSFTVVERDRVRQRALLGEDERG